MNANEPQRYKVEFCTRMILVRVSKPNAGISNRFRGRFRSERRFFCCRYLIATRCYIVNQVVSYQKAYQENICVPGDGNDPSLITQLILAVYRPGNPGLWGEKVIPRSSTSTSASSVGNGLCSNDAPVPRSICRLRISYIGCTHH
jgi:hypothetical protein